MPGFSGGYAGVDVFFVISGYLITGIVWPGLGDGSFSAQDFYLRRVRRIFPALFAVLFASSIAAAIILFPKDLAEFGSNLMASVLFYTNFNLIKQTSYFQAPALENPLLHVWSLSVEEQFYAVWPLSLLLLKRTVAADKIPFVIIVLALISLTLAEARLTHYPKDAFYFPWCRWWELLIGALIAILPAFRGARWLATILGGAGLAGIFLAVALYDQSTRFPGLTALLPCSGAAFIILSGNAHNPVSRLLSFEPIRRIGLISYSLYLIHWPLFSFSHIYMGQTLPAGLTAALVMASFVLAYLSWYFIETPFRAARFPKIRAVWTAAAAMGLLWVAGFAFNQSGGLPLRFDEAALQKISSIEDLDWDLAKYCRHIAVPGTGKGDACEFGADRGGRYDFILWGDSHARHFVPAISSLANARRLSGVLFWKGGCPAFLRDSHTLEGCAEFNDAVVNWISGHPIKLAILAGRWQNHLKEIKRYRVEAAPELNAGGLAKTLAFLGSRNIAVSVIDQTPDFAYKVANCVVRAWFYERDSEPCVTQPAARFFRWHRDVDDYFGFLRKRYEFSLARPAEVICDSEQCHARDGTTLLMIDTNHLTEAGALRLVPHLNIPLLTGAGNEQNLAVQDPTPSKAIGGPPL
jgi:peptidoglycan/LPS O-acetylase OafA/YrhL